MNFLTPGAIAIAAALTVPPLVALYFLKLRRQEVPISSTFLWKRAVQDLQVNAPFQRLRRNLLLLLQLLVLLLGAVALGQPLLREEQRMEKSLILLIDRSASMNVVEPDGRTRLQRAKDEALKTIQQVGSEYDRAMVIAFSSRAQILAPFSNNQALLDRAVQSITPSDGLSRLTEAIALAEAHAQTQIVETEGITATPVPTGPPAQGLLFSDGRLEDSANITVERIKLEHINVGLSDDNIGITALSASRYYERPDMLNVVAAIQNFGPATVELDVELLIEGRHRDIQTIALEPGIAPVEAPDSDFAAASAVVSFDEVEFSGSGVVEARLSRADALPHDNSAYAVVGKPRQVGVLLVTGGNSTLEKVLGSMPIELALMSPDGYETAPEAEMTEGGRSRYDVTIFDNCATARLPTGSYFFFGEVPQLEGFGRGEEVELDVIYNWDDSHAIMRHVKPMDIHEIFQYRQMVLPPGAESLMDAERGSVMSLLNHKGNRYLISAFALHSDDGTMNTIWPARLHFVYFMENAVQFLSGVLDTQIEADTRPGDTITIEAAGTEDVTVERPDGTRDTAVVGTHRTAHYGKLDRVGVYTVSPTIKGSTDYAVNLFSANESRVQPNAELVIGGEIVPSEDAVQLTNVPLWPYFLLAAFAFLMFEWAVYSKRIRV